MQALSDKIRELEKLKSDSSLKVSELHSQHTTEIASEKEKAHQVKQKQVPYDRYCVCVSAGYTRHMPDPLTFP